MFAPPSPDPSNSDSSYYGSDLDAFDPSFPPTSVAPSHIWGHADDSFLDMLSPLPPTPPAETSFLFSDVPTGTVNPCAYSSNPLPSPPASIDRKIFFDADSFSEPPTPSPQPEPRPRIRKEKPVKAVTKEVVESVSEDGEEMFPCEFPDCTRKFNRLQNLRAHVKCHTNERPYPCDKCPSKFRRLPDLERHKRSIHNTSRPFVCQECGKAYARSDALKRHLVSKSSLHGCLAAKGAILPLPLPTEIGSC
ncbi:hypothetical protein HDV00_007526 [Rhizophlyctis rosea]|nr:hypothetical protein HDV00_007526 [Rhizophlyctis rosea]